MNAIARYLGALEDAWDFEVELVFVPISWILKKDSENSFFPMLSIVLGRNYKRTNRPEYFLDCI